jgi:hypothetical protein
MKINLKVLFTIELIHIFVNSSTSKDMYSAQSCDLSLNIAISRWYAFAIFVICSIILFIILTKIILKGCKKLLIQTSEVNSDATQPYRLLGD